MADNTIKKEYRFCLRCGRKLIKEETRRIGYGKVCLERQKVNKTKRLF